MPFDVHSEADLAVVESAVLTRLAKPKSDAALPRIQTAAELYNRPAQELRPLFDRLLYDGLTMLIAAPKAGKSWLALQLSIAVAGGPEVDGITANETGKVLFAALEEPAARTGSRLRRLAAPGTWSNNLMFVNELLPLMGGGAEQLSELIRQAQPRFVVVDTLTALAKAGKRDSDVFRAQYEEVNSLRAICSELRVAALLIHHTRKGPADGPVEAVAGTGGVSAGVDALWLLKRKPEGLATLEVVGREIEEQCLELEFQRHEPFGWRFTGSSGIDAAMTAERRALIDLLRDEGGMTPKQIAAELGRSRMAVRQMLKRMVEAGQLWKQHDKYFPSLTVSHRVTEKERGDSDE